ncbi:MAG: M28 family peptidase [Pyrinomonadaceae bacterium]|nr:M28 family peptidase [Pyrinomonadaceae bacterium]
MLARRLAYEKSLARPARCFEGKRALLFILLLAFGLAGCKTGPTAPTNSNSNQSTASAPTPTTAPATPQPQAQATTFDGQRAFDHVRKQVDFGPRPAGSTELAMARDYIIGELKSYGLNVTTDEWTATTPVGARKMVNVTATLAGESEDAIMLSSHYDTKLYKKFRFVGANDGGSSTGALLEMARVLAANNPKPKFTYRFVFFDGEEAFCEGWDQCKNPDGPDNTYGSRRYVAQLQKQNELPRLRAMILLDMIGYSNLMFGRDEELSTPWLVDAVWQTARELGYGKNFVNLPESVGGDDHKPFHDAGVTCMDIIQLENYPYWHTEDDTLDKISPQSLKIVGDVVLGSLPRIEQKLLSGKTM